MKFGSLYKALVIPTLSVLVVAAVIVVTAVTQQVERRENEHAEAVARLLAGVAVPYVTNFDLTALGNLVKQLAADKELAFAEIVDPGGKSFTADAMAAPRSLDGLLHVNQKIVDASGSHIGTVRLAYRRDAIIALRDTTAWHIGLALAVVALLVVVVMTTVVRKVMRQLGGEPAYAAAVVAQVAAGDLTVRIETDAKDQASLLYAMKRMMASLTGMVGDIKQASEAIDTAAAEMAQGHVNLSNRTEMQAASLEQTASSMEELTATVKQNADNARQADKVVASTSEVAAKGGAMVRQVVDTMNGISESSRKISDIIGVMDGIAFQTNILALNAAVEAARAGEQGRGFAVVASEVRGLAQRSAAAAKEIKTLIENSVQKVDSGVKLVSEAGRTMEDMVSSVNRVTEIMSQIIAASQEQSSGIEQVNSTVTQMDQITQQNAALVEQAAASGSSMEQQARKLVETVAQFKLDGNTRAPAPSAVVAPTRAAATPIRDVPMPAVAATVH
jgi:methyl-accepting chemotaxis protein